MRIHPLYTAISAAILSGCSFVTTQDGEQLRAKAHQPICLSDCTITITTEEGVPSTPAQPATTTPPKENPP
jgi:hypothetical protein